MAPNPQPEAQRDLADNQRSANACKSRGVFAAPAARDPILQVQVSREAPDTWQQIALRVLLLEPSGSDAGDPAEFGLVMMRTDA